MYNKWLNNETLTTHLLRKASVWNVLIKQGAASGEVMIAEGVKKV